MHRVQSVHGMTDINELHMLLLWIGTQKDIGWIDRARPQRWLFEAAGFHPEAFEYLLQRYSGKPALSGGFGHVALHP